MNAKEYNIIKENIFEFADRKSLRGITRFNALISLAEELGIMVDYFMTVGSTPTQINFTFKKKLEMYLYDKELGRYILEHTERR